MKLSTKISILLMCAVTITGFLIGSLTIEATSRSFDEFTFDLWEPQLNTWEQIYTTYYVNNGYSWDGVDRVRQTSLSFDPLTLRSSGSEVILADKDGRILTHPDKQFIGGRINHSVLKEGRPLTLEGGQVIGILFPEVYFDSQFWSLEENFANKVAVAAMRGIFFTSLFAVLLGLALSQSIVIPLKNLIKAASRMAKGNFTEQLPIYSNDEIGDLSRAFNAMAQEIDKGNTVRRQMFADISHELRTPLTVLASKLEGTLEKNTALDPIEVSVLYDEVIRLNGLVNELQDLSKLEAGHAALSKTLINFQGFFQDFFVLIQAEATARGITLEIEMAEDLPYCYADPQRLKQIILNLVNNALRYTPDGGTVLIRVKSDSNDFIFQVKDNGIGISPDDLPYIFQRFYRADKSRERSTGGTGLGLAITKGFVDAHGGEISVESALGQGTMFQVRLPLYKEEAEEDGGKGRK